MPNQIYAILGIILFGGILGGFVSAFISDEHTHSRAFFVKRVVIGIGCASLVPLFLNMISSTLIGKSETSPADYFVFAGFCVIAAISSESFITMISVRALRQEISDVKTSMTTIIASQTEPETTRYKSIIPDIVKSLSASDLAILKALNHSKYSMRTLEGISKDADLNSKVTADLIEQLLNIGLAAKSTDASRIHKNVWYLTQLGKATIESILQSDPQNDRPTPQSPIQP